MSHCREEEGFKLYYFDLKVLAEPIRMIFHYTGQKFEDIRVQFEDWPQLKPTLGWGKMPVLQFEGHELTQSAAIARYFARKHGLAGSTEYESAKCDEYVDAAKDFRQEWRLYNFEPDPVKKEEFRVRFIQIHCPHYLTRFNRIVEENGGHWLVGSGVTWADFFLVVFLELFQDTIDPNLLKGYPALENLKKNVYSIPQIKSWADIRPNTKF